MSTKMNTTKRTMTLNLTEMEMKVLEGLSEKKDINKTSVLRQALRLYQLVEARVEGGSKLYFENDKEKAEVMIL